MRYLLVIVLTLAAQVAVAGRNPVLFVVVRNLPPSEVTTRVQAGCLQKGMAVEQATETQVICSRPMDDSMRSILIRAIATPSYSTNPVYKYRVNAIRVGDQTTVSAEEFVQYQNAYGQMTTIPITNKKELALTQAGLDTMKAAWEAKLASELAPTGGASAAQVSAGGSDNRQFSYFPDTQLPRTTPVQAPQEGKENGGQDPNPQIESLRKQLEQSNLELARTRRALAASNVGVKSGGAGQFTGKKTMLSTSSVSGATKWNCEYAVGAKTVWETAYGACPSTMEIH